MPKSTKNDPKMTSKMEPKSLPKSRSIFIPGLFCSSSFENSLHMCDHTPENSHRIKFRECSPGVWNQFPENIHRQLISGNALRVSDTTLRGTLRLKRVPRMFSGRVESASGEHSHRNQFGECAPGVIYIYRENA